MHGTSHRPNIIIKPAIATDRRLWKRAPKKWNFHLKTNASNNIDADYTAFRGTIWAREMFRSLWFVGYDIWVRWVNWQKPQWTSTSRRSFKSNTFTMNRLLTQWISEQQRSLCELKGPTVLFRPVSACRPSDPDTFRAISLTLIPYIFVCFVCLWLEVFFNSFFIFRSCGICSSSVVCTISFSLGVRVDFISYRVFISTEWLGCVSFRLLLRFLQSHVNKNEFFAGSGDAHTNWCQTLFLAQHATGMKWVWAQQKVKKDKYNEKWKMEGTSWSDTSWVRKKTKRMWHDSYAVLVF